MEGVFVKVVNGNLAESHKLNFLLGFCSSSVKILRSGSMVKLKVGLWEVQM